MTAGNRSVPVLLILAAFMFVLAPYIIDTAPYESTMGLVQRLQRRLERLHGGLVPGGERVIMRLEEVELPGRVLRPGLTPP